MTSIRQLTLQALPLLVLLVAPTLHAMEAVGETVEEAVLAKAADEVLSLQLWLAAQEGNEERVCELLLHPEIDVNFRLPESAEKFASFTPLMIAITYGHPGVVALLLKHPHMDVTLTNKNDNNALYMGVREPECLKLLLEAQKAGMLTPALDLNAKCFGGRTAFYGALEGEYWQSALLLSGFPDVDPNMGAEGTPFYPLRVLVGASADNINPPADKRNAHSGTYLMLQSIMFSMVERGLILLRRECELNKYILVDFADGAVIGRYVWPLLCAFGGSEGDAPVDGQRRLHLSLPFQEGLTEAQDELSRFLWILIDGKDDDCRLINIKRCIDSCLSKNASIVAQDPFTSLTPWMALAAQGENGALEKCLKWYPEIDINARACNGWHALHVAAYTGHRDTVNYLLCLLAIETHPRTDSGLTPYGLALIGAKARATARETESDLSVCNILDEFNARRFAVLMALCRIRKEIFPLQFPKEIMKMLVRSYRF